MDSKYKVLDLDKLCNKIDKKITKCCRNLDFIKKNESYINIFDKLYQSVFKEDNLPGINKFRKNNYFS